MNKRHLHHIWRTFRRINPWYFVVLAVVSGAICVGTLRSNNQHMVRLRDAVYAADQNNGDVTGTLNALRDYVNGHMNTNLSSGNDSVYPPIQLKYTYDRLVQAAGAQAASQNAQIYNDAQHYCEQQNSVDFSGHNRVPCITQYVTAHGLKTSPIPDDLYKFNFASPTWSPDLAGWSMVVAALSLLSAIILFVTRRWFEHLMS